MTQNYPLHHHQILESAKTVIERPKHILCIIVFSLIQRKPWCHLINI